MTPPFRPHLITALAVALILPPIGLAAADEIVPPAVEADAATAEPESPATETDADCGCGARSPGQLLETQRDVEEAVTADPGS